MNTFAWCALSALMPLCTFQAVYANEDETSVCSTYAPPLAQKGVSMLQYSKSFTAAGANAESSQEAQSYAASQFAAHRSGLLEAAGYSSGERSGHTDGHSSVFKIKIENINTGVYHAIFAAMIFFTVLVDRVQRLISLKAETSVVETRLLGRVNAELMMFGIVGLVIFTLTNLVDLPEDVVLLTHYTDIFASLAACTMIAVTIYLYFLKQLLAVPLLEKYEAAMSERKTRIVGNDEDIVSRCSTLFTRLEDKDYDNMASKFCATHRLPEGVKYGDYLSQCLVFSACDIMDIHWTSWLPILALALVAVVEQDILHGFVVTSYFYDVQGYIVLNWFFFSSSVVVYFLASRAFSKMLAYLAAISRGEEAELENPMPGKMPERMKHGMQAITLLMCFNLAFFVMTWIYNLNLMGAAWTRYVVMLMPFLLSTVFLLPLTIWRFTIAHAFYEPHQEALDALYEQYDRLEDDLNYLGRLYERHGRPELPDLDKGCNEEALTKIVRGLGLHISSIRMHRIFEQIDEDRSGEVDAQEFFEKLAVAGEASVPMKSFSPARTRNK